MGLWTFRIIIIIIRIIAELLLLKKKRIYYYAINNFGTLLVVRFKIWTLKQNHLRSTKSKVFYFLVIRRKEKVGSTMSEVQIRLYLFVPLSSVPQSVSVSRLTHPSLALFSPSPFLHALVSSSRSQAELWWGQRRMQSNLIYTAKPENYCPMS